MAMWGSWFIEMGFTTGESVEFRGRYASKGYFDLCCENYLDVADSSSISSRPQDKIVADVLPLICTPNLRLAHFLVCL
jgi:hypothetical protein